MNAKELFILDEYRQQKNTFEHLENLVVQKLDTLLKAADVKIYAINHRIKDEKSLEGKLERKGDKYNDLHDITDILGVRIICFFQDDVDKIARLAEKTFAIDWEKSIDKRKFLNVNSFGYLALHYICSLKIGEDAEADKEGLTHFRFELQMCSLLQHVWASMEHDLGYKTKFGVPKAVARDFSRLAGLLEIADEHFSRIRDTVATYIVSTHQKIVNDNANDIPLDSVSLDEYMRYSNSMGQFLKRIAKICNSEIVHESLENYLEELSWFKLETIGDLQRLLADNAELAFRMAEDMLSCAELDILNSTVALRFLCRAELINGEYTKKQAAQFFYLSSKNQERSEKYAEKLFSDYGKQEQNP